MKVRYRITAGPSLARLANAWLRYGASSALVTFVATRTHEQNGISREVPITATGKVRELRHASDGTVEAVIVIVQDDVTPDHGVEAIVRQYNHSTGSGELTWVSYC